VAFRVTVFRISHDVAETHTRRVVAWISPRRSETNSCTESLSCYNSVVFHIVVAFLVTPRTAASRCHLLPEMGKSVGPGRGTRFEHRAICEISAGCAGSIENEVLVPAVEAIVEGCCTHLAESGRFSLNCIVYRQGSYLRCVRRFADCNRLDIFARWR